MTPERFRELALLQPEAEEGAHQGHPDFRVGGKIFATLGPEGDWGMVKLPPELQTTLVRAPGQAFEAFPGAWGKQGCTKVLLAKVEEEQALADALHAAWCKVAPKKLIARSKEHDG